MQLIHLSWTWKKKIKVYIWKNKINLIYFLQKSIYIGILLLVNMLPSLLNKSNFAVNSCKSIWLIYEFVYELI